MGEVYRARDTRLGRDVAIKVVASEVAADPDSVRRFEREARALAALAHPNVVPVFDLGVEGTMHYVVTELVEGETLRQRLATGALPPPEVAEVGAQVADGLAAAHAKGLVHRDIKPENIILADGRARILDFGIARRLELGAPKAQGDSTTASMTDVRTIMGTPGYMSPEQVRGQPVDARSDLFSLGAVLFEMLTGRRAFAGASTIETIDTILRDEPDLSAKEVPASFVPVLERCLAKDRDARFGSALELARDLRGAVSWEGTALPRLGGTRRASAIGVLPFRSLGGELAAHFGLGLADAVIGRLATFRELTVRPTSAVRRFEEEPSDAIEAGRQLGVEAVVEGTVRQVEGVTRVLVQLTDVGRRAIVWSDQLDLPKGRLFELEDAIATRLVQRLRIKLDASARNAPGRTRPVSDRVVQRYLGASARLFDARNEPDWARDLVTELDSVVDEEPNFAPAIAARAYVRAWDNYFSPEPDGPEAVLRDAEKALSLDHELPLPHVARAVLLWSPQGDWNFVDAVRALRTAIELSPGCDIAHLDLASIFNHWGWVREFREELQELRRIDPLSADLARESAGLTVLDGHRREALEQFRQVASGRLHGIFGKRYNMLHLRLQIGDEAGLRDEAEAWVREEPANKVALALLALAMARTGDRDITELEERIHATYTHTGHFHHVLHILAEARAQLGDTLGAIDCLRRAAEAGLPCLPRFDGDPLLSPIHGTPEYAALRTELLRKHDAERGRLRDLGRPATAGTR